MKKIVITLLLSLTTAFIFCDEKNTPPTTTPDIIEVEGAELVLNDNNSEELEENEKEELRTDRTFAIIKPDAVATNYAGEIIRIIELNGFVIAGMKKITLTQKQAQEFYAVHKDRPFYNELVAYMTSGPVIVMTLDKENAIADWRTLMGATNPKNASVGTLRKMFGKNITNNAVHGSDAPETAAQEVKFFFPELA